MNRSRVPPQIVRLVLLTVGIVGSYLVARYFLTPQSFGQYGGFYRGAALAELSSYNRVYAGSKACEECHEDQIRVLHSGAHKTLACEGCHGAALAHVENPDIKPQILNFSHCARCHEANPSRPKWHKQITARTHYPGDTCTGCHIPHNPTEVPPEPAEETPAKGAPAKETPTPEAPKTP